MQYISNYLLWCGSGTSLSDHVVGFSVESGAVVEPSCAGLVATSPPDAVQVMAEGLESAGGQSEQSFDFGGSQCDQAIVHPGEERPRPAVQLRRFPGHRLGLYHDGGGRLKIVLRHNSMIRKVAALVDTLTSQDHDLLLPYQGSTDATSSGKKSFSWCRHRSHLSRWAPI
jgi:hypothetical protein